VIDNHMKKLELQLEQLAEARQRLLDQHLEASILEKVRSSCRCAALGAAAHIHM
jgi:uncharacterized iron-regulated protein